MRSAILAASVVLASWGGATAQRTIIVDWMMGVGAHYRDIPAAEAAANHGDTILCRLGWYTTPQTSKAIAILGNGSQLQGDIKVTNIPAGRAFRIAGFWIRRDQALRAVIENNLGAVHFEEVRALEPGMGGWGAAVQIKNSRAVSLQGCETFGAPCVSAENSNVVLANCWLGVTSIHVGGGYSLVARDATVTVAEPTFDSSNSTQPAISLTRGQLILTGSSSSFVQGGTNASAIHGQGGAILLDPRVRLNPRSSAAAITGNAALTRRTVPVTLATGTAPGKAMPISVTGRATAFVQVMLSGSLHGAPWTVPGLGDVWLDPATLLMVGNGVTDSRGSFGASLPIPGFVPRGLALVLQSVTLANGSLSLSTASVVVIP